MKPFYKINVKINTKWTVGKLFPFNEIKFKK